MKNNITLIIGLVLTLNCFSQSSMIKRTSDLVESKKYDAAKACIDSCLADKKYENNAEAWYLKGFVYKGIYKERESTNKESASRLTALEAFAKSMTIDQSKENTAKNAANITYLSALLYNDVIPLLDTVHYEAAIRSFNLYKKYFAMVDTSINHNSLKKLDVEFNMALATEVYSKLYIYGSKHNIKYYDWAKQTFGEVLKVGASSGAIKNLEVLEYDKKLFDGKLMSVSKYYGESGSVDKTVELIKTELKKGAKAEYYVNENEINNLGYELLKLGKTNDALKIFTLNTELFASSYNTFDSLGECLLKLGKKEEGVAAYKKSLELNPKNDNARKILSETK